MNDVSPNVAPMPTDWWALYEYSFKPLGICEDFDEAEEKADTKFVGNMWIIDRPELNAMLDEITNEISSTASVATDAGNFWWVFVDGKFKPVGVHRDFEKASDAGDKEFPANVWTIDREGLIDLRNEISKELNHGFPSAGGGTF